jgi:hypothetical protein
MIAQARLDAIHARPLSEIVGRDVTLKKAGRELLGLCPFHDEKTPSFTVNDRKRFFHCFGCGAHGDAIAFARQRYSLSLPAAVELLEQDAGVRTLRPAPPESRRGVCESNNSGAMIAEILRGCVPAADSPVEAYITQARSLQWPADLVDLHYHPACPRGADRLPAMVAVMRDIHHNEPCGLHRTYLRPDGSGKADVTPSKMMLGRAAGAVIKLCADEDVTLGLGIAEGIEDAIAIIGSDWRPVWACGSSGAIREFPVLRGIEALTVFCDADNSGISAARACVERWRHTRKEAVVLPPPGAKDFAEMVALNG